MNLTIKSVLTSIRALGLSASYTGGEFVVNFQRGDLRYTKDSGYYTNDRTDALATARHMYRSPMPKVRKDSRFMVSEATIDAVNEFADLMTRTIDSKASDETFHECQLCGGVDGHDRGCLMPAVRQWLRG